MLKKDKDRYGMQNGGPKPDFLDLDGDGNKEESMKKASEDKKEMREPKIFGGIARQAAKLLKGAKGKASESLNDRLNKVGNEILKFQDRPARKGETIFLEGIGEVPGRPVKRLDSGSLEEISNMILDNGGDLNDVVRYFEKISKAQKDKNIENLDDILDEISREFPDSDMREPKIFGGIARQAAKLLKGAKGKVSETSKEISKTRGASEELQKFIASSKTGMKTTREGMQEPFRGDELADILKYNQLVSNPEDRIFYPKLNYEYRYFFENLIDKEDGVVTIKDAKEALEKGKKELKEMAKEADTGREMDELNMFKDTIENLENDIQMILQDKKADVAFSEGGSVDKQMEQLRNMYEEGGEAKMLPDEQMEEQFVDFVIDEALSDKEESMLMEQLEANPELSMIFDKVIEKASEFTGAGEVEGPGTGTSDSIPARLSDGEFVFTAKAVKQLGVDYLNKMMDDAEAAFDAGEDRKPMVHGGPHPEEMDDDNMSNMPQQVEMNYNINRPESVSTVNPLLAKDEEEDLISQELKKGMLGRPNIRS